MADGPRTVRRRLHRRRGKATNTEPPPGPQVPRIARLMAAAIVLQELLDRGEFRSCRELAGVAQVSPARMSQILALTQLAPQIQEAILAGDVDVSERRLRLLVSTFDWTGQLAFWEDHEST